MSWLFSAALVAAFSAENSWDGEPCAPLNVMPTPRPFSHRDKTTDILTRSLFGQMSRDLTADLGTALLTWYRAGFPARTSAPPDAGKGSGVGAVDCGPKWPGSLAKYDLDSCSWKTAQHSLLGGWESFSGIWPQWGTMLNGAFWEQTTAVPHTSENGSGFWPTPTVTGNYNRAGISPKAGDGLATAVRKIPTPRGRDWKDTGSVPPSRLTDPGKDTLGQYIARDNPGGKLNPYWVEWLMGWPVGWTDFASLAKDKYQSWPQQHGVS